MYPRSKRPTYDVFIGNVPKEISEKEINHKFALYGECQSILVRLDKNNSRYVIVKYYCEPDGDRALRECHKAEWNGNIMSALWCKRNQTNKKQNLPPEKDGYLAKQNVAEGNFNGNNEVHESSNLKYPRQQNVSNVSVHKQASTINVYCTSVEDPITYFGNHVSKLEDLQLITSQLQVACPTLPRLNSKPEKRQVYAALFSEDGSWYRCVVVDNTCNLESKTCTVSYIDYGNSEDVSFSNIVKLPESLQNTSPLATRCAVTSVVPVDGISPTALNEITAHFKKLLFGQILTVTTTSPQDKPIYFISHCMCNGVDVVAEVVNKGFARYKSKPVSDKAEKFSNPQGSNIRQNFKSPATFVVGNNSSANQQNNKVSTVEKSNRNSAFQVERGNFMQNNLNINAHSMSNVIDPPARRPLVRKNQFAHDKNSEMKLQNKNNGLDDVSSEVNRLNLHRHKDTQLNQLQDTYALLKDQKVVLERIPNENCIGETIDAIISTLKIVRNIRQLIQLSEKNNLLDTAMDFLKNKPIFFSHSKDSFDGLALIVGSYYEALEEIKKCSDRDQLPVLISKKEASRIQVMKTLNDCFGTESDILFKQKDEIDKTITDLKKSVHTFLDIYIEKSPSDFNELLSEYKKLKEQRQQAIQNAQDTTNKLHEAFMQFFVSFGKLFDLNSGESLDFANSLSTNERQPVSWSSEFANALKAFKEALQNEVVYYTVSNNNSRTISVMSLIIAELQVLQQKIGSNYTMYEQNKLTYNGLCITENGEPLLRDLEATRKEVKTLKSKFRHKLADKKDIEECSGYDKSDLKTIEHELDEIQFQLHSKLLKEDDILNILATASEMSFPELNILYPELNLPKYTEMKCLLKSNWEPECFTLSRIVTRVGVAYRTKFLSSAIIIKESLLSAEDKMYDFVHKAKQWNDIKSSFLVEVKGIFTKDYKVVYAFIFSNAQSLIEFEDRSNFFDMNTSCYILHQVLEGLSDLHANSMAHGALQPSSVLFENGNVKIDFCYEARNLPEREVLRGINFHMLLNQAPSASNDMYNFGCLVLWVLFPNLTFTFTSEGAPNFYVYKSTLEEVLCQEDYATLSSLLYGNPNQRPSASALLKCNFLKNCLRTTAQKCNTLPLQQNFQERNLSVMQRSFRQNTFQQNRY